MTILILFVVLGIAFWVGHAVGKKDRQMAQFVRGYLMGVEEGIDTGYKISQAVEEPDAFEAQRRAAREGRQ